jgi:hypothetical protein
MELALSPTVIRTRDFIGVRGKMELGQSTRRPDSAWLSLPERRRLRQNCKASLDCEPPDASHSDMRIIALIDCKSVAKSGDYLNETNFYEKTRPH